MNNLDNMPSIGSSAYGASTSVFSLTTPVQDDFVAIPRQIGLAHQQVAAAPLQHLRQDRPAMAAAPSRRLVQVFIADPDDNVPLDKSLLYSGEQKLTDATDQELFFEIDIKSVLAAHNAERVKIINRKVKERTEFLEPAKIRDLKMVVVNVATF